MLHNKGIIQMVIELIIGTVMPTLIALMIVVLIAVILRYGIFERFKLLRIVYRFPWIFVLCVSILSLSPIFLSKKHTLEYSIIYLKEIFLSVVFSIIVLMVWLVSKYIFRKSEDMRKYHLNQEIEYNESDIDEHIREYVDDNTGIAICVGSSIILPQNQGEENI